MYNVVKNKNGWYDVVDDIGNVISGDFTEEIDAWIWLEENEN